MKAVLALLLAIFICGNAQAAIKFPQLTDWVNDNANVLSKSAISSLDELLKEHEDKTTNQIVVVTLSSLQGYAIEDYGYQLGRAWQIGQKGKNNGVILLIAPTEHKVRIEVGYGLEGTLTDTISAQIVNQIILPQFKAGNLQQGIIDGTQAIVSVLSGHQVTLPQAAPEQANQRSDIPAWAWILIIIVIIFLRFRFGVMFIPFGGFSGSSGGGSSFSGGGGSFGGGGSSGSW